jgi:hypothetical protein
MRAYLRRLFSQEQNHHKPARENFWEKSIGKSRSLQRIKGPAKRVSKL